MPKRKVDSLDYLVNAAAAASPSEQRRLIMKATAGKNVVVKKSPAKKGRPQGYTDKIGNEICRKLSEGQTLPRIVADMNLSLSCVYRWLEDEKLDFREKYKAARASLAETLVYELISSTAELDKDTALPAKVRAGIVTWFASRMNPAYADSRRLELKAEINHRVVHELSSIQKERIALSWLASQQTADDSDTGNVIEHEPDIPGVTLIAEPERVIPKRRRAVLPAKPAASADDSGRWSGGRRGGV